MNCNRPGRRNAFPNPEMRSVLEQNSQLEAGALPVPERTGRRRSHSSSGMKKDVRCSHGNAGNSSVVAGVRLVHTASCGHKLKNKNNQINKTEYIYNLVV